ncbi:MAG TPA: proton-conducting transporter membrane subunit [Prochlorococcus sp.]
MPSSSEIAWLIPVLPLSGACFIGLLLISFNLTMNRLSKPVSLLLASCVGSAAVLSYTTLAEQLAGADDIEVLINLPGIENLPLQIGFSVDVIGAEMLSLISTTGVLLMVFAHIYMTKRKGYVHFFIYLGFFTSTLLGLALSPNLLEMYVFWVLMGISSYLLIGFWYDPKGIAKTAQKVFLIDRIGDVGLLIGCLGLVWKTGSLGFNDIGSCLQEAISAGNISNLTVIVLCVLLVMGPIAKSIEFPLYVWRPDSLTTSVPISALIHAITVAGVGIFVFTRIQPVLTAGTTAFANSNLAQLLS